MKQKLISYKLTPQEFELIESVRNYNNSFPNGWPQLHYFCHQLLDGLLKFPYE